MRGGYMRLLKSVYGGTILAVLTLMLAVDSAFAGDGATIVLKSGAIITINNGYTQIVGGMKEFNRRGTENFNAEINMEGTTFFINLADVALVCRDECKSLEIKFPEREK
jgi:hypothetical protein